MGRSDYDPFAAGKQHRDFFTCNSSDSDRNLFYDPHKIFAGQAFPGYDKSTYGKKENEGQSFHISDAVVSTATRVGMGNLVGVVAAISAGGAGAVSGCG